jgi:hypothetical protein
MVFGVLLAGWITGTASAQVDGLWMYIKDGANDTLTADGKSRTTVMVDLSGCTWYPSSGPGGMIQIEFQNTHGITASPPSINSTKGELGSPFELTITAGNQSGTAKVSATASYCSEGNVMAFGVCSSKEEADNPKCTGEFLVTVLPGQSSEEVEESEEESEESQELSAAIGCTPKNPQVGQSVSCTVSVNGAREGEKLEFLWSLEGVAGTRTKDRVYTWTGSTYGYYEVGIEVFGKDRSTTKTLRVEVSEGEPGEEQKTGDETAGGEVTELRDSLDSFLRTAGLNSIDPARLGAAGAGVATLITIWMIIQHRSGVPMEKLEQAIGQWRWRKGAELPKALPESEQKPGGKSPDKPPDKLPEAEKQVQASEPPTKLPEQKEDDGKARVSASAAFDLPTEAEPVTASKPPADKAVSGETSEERAERLVGDMEDYRKAVDKTLSTFDEKLKKVPDKIKESKFWKERVAPQLKKLDDLKLKDKSAKLKEFLRITKELIQVRKRVDTELSVFSKEDREGVVWLVRGLKGGQEALSKLHRQLITDPAIAAAKAGLSKEQAAAVEKFLNRHQTEIEEMLKGIRDLPISFGKVVGKYQRRHLIVGQIKKDMAGTYDSKWKHTEKFDITKSPKKLLPVIKKVENAGSAVMKKLGRVFIFLRDTTPKQD